MTEVISAKTIRRDGNLAMQNNAYEKAIQLYSDALQVKDLQCEEKGLLYSNRSNAYLQCAIKSGDTVGENQKLALLDAEEVIKLRPTWWKGYFRAGQIYQFKREWNLAIDSYDQALALNPSVAEAANCRDECRYDRSLAVNQGAMVSHGLKAKMNIFNEEKALNLDSDAIILHYEELMKSENRKERAAACVFFGELYVQGVDVPQDLVKGAELFQEAVDVGLPQAMTALGLLYMEGKGVPRNIKKGVNLFERAVQYKPKEGNFSQKYGITDAQFQIGKCYQEGIGKPVDYYQASGWYEKASDGGHSGAANNLGFLYMHGFGVKKCSIQAKKYCSLAASRGNILAMESLAWICLEEKEFEESRDWYTRAVESGNVNSILRKDNFDKALDEARIDSEQFEKIFSNLSTSDENVKSELKSSFSPQVSNLIDACDRVNKFRPHVISYVDMKDSPLEMYWTHFEEIKKQSQDGHPFAQTLLTSMSYFAEGMHYLEKIIAKSINSGEIEHVRAQSIHNLANSFRETEIVACFYPSLLQNVMKVCKTCINTNKSDLDLAARVVYCTALSASQSHEMLPFVKVSCEKYPDEPYLYKIYCGTYAVLQNFKASLKVCIQGLNKFPKNTDLLFCKAGIMKMLPSPRDEVIAAYKEFIKEAPFDQRMIPEAYYNIAYCSLSKESDTAKMYYTKGLEEERKLLPCFIPYTSNVKNVLEAILQVGDNYKNEVSTQLQLMHSTRLRYRETLNKMVESRSKLKHGMVNGPMNQFKPKRVNDMKEITFRDMTPRKDHVYNDRIINLLIAEDPMLGIVSAIHTVVRDDNGDCLNCAFNELDHNDEYVRRCLCFGSKIRVLNPHYRLDIDGSIVLQVDDPKNIILQSSGKDKQFCRYCWKESPNHACGRCKQAKYCCRDCQTNDWKILKHKLICRLEYLENI